MMRTGADAITSGWATTREWISSAVNTEMCVSERSRGASENEERTWKGHIRRIRKLR
jgi:hypothetical protein